MNTTNHFREDIWPIYVTWLRENSSVALVTLLEIEGSSPRPLGAHLIVASDGKTLGQISGGCCEQAIRAEALDALAQGKVKFLRYGQGSPFHDIVLPCGSSLWVRIDPFLPDALLDKIVARLEARQSFALFFSDQDHPPGWTDDSELDESSRTHRCSDGLLRCYRPSCRMLLAGLGSIVPYVIDFCESLEVFTLALITNPRLPEMAGLNPQLRIIDVTAHDEIKALSTEVDRFTAIVTLFHDHDREDEILELARLSPAFYVGALGSRRTHELRILRLKEKGWSDEQCSRIRGPAGIPLQTKSPPAIALSIVAEMLMAKERICD